MFNYEKSTISNKITHDIENLTSTEIKSALLLMNISEDEKTLFFNIEESILEIFPETLFNSNQSDVIASTIQIAERTAYLLFISMKTYIDSKF